MKLKISDVAYIPDKEVYAHVVEVWLSCIHSESDELSPRGSNEGGSQHAFGNVVSKQR